MRMQAFGRTSLHEFLGDRVVYRNLAPADPLLPALDDAWREIGLSSPQIPRKSESEYARVIVHLLDKARALDKPGEVIQRLIFVGDTRMNDGTAFDNLCRVGRWPGLAFIGSENKEPRRVEVLPSASGQRIYLANRWEALAEFEDFCESQGLAIDQSTAVVLDLDKTALGARGRNAHVIDEARVQAVRDTVAGLLSDTFNETIFLQAYNRLKQEEFHPFTADNQDYLAYICLILSGGLFDLETVVREVQSGALNSFHEFIKRVGARKSELSPALASIHSEIYANVEQGDPTPFKPFRRKEYLATVGRMGSLPDSEPVDALLAREIVITQEVRALALAWQERGALIFGLSDKPDEASIPEPELARRGFQPIHRTETHAVGSAS